MAELNLTDCDLIVSNLAFQWVSPTMIEKAHAHALKTFAFSTMISGSLDTWKTRVNQYEHMTWPVYPSCEELVELCYKILKNEIFNYYVINLSMDFSNSSEWMRHLKNTGTSASEHAPSFHTMKQLLCTQNEPITIDYKIFIGIFHTQSRTFL